MEEYIELLLQLAFEQGQAYQRIYDKAGLDNVIDFNNVAFANSCGAQWKLRGTMQNLPQLFKCNQVDSRYINSLNEIAENLKKIKEIAKETIREEENK